MARNEPRQLDQLTEGEGAPGIHSGLEPEYFEGLLDEDVTTVVSSEILVVEATELATGTIDELRAQAQILGASVTNRVLGATVGDSVHYRIFQSAVAMRRTGDDAATDAFGRFPQPPTSRPLGTQFWEFWVAGVTAAVLRSHVAVDQPEIASGHEVALDNLYTAQMKLAQHFLGITPGTALRGNDVSAMYSFQELRLGIDPFQAS